MDTMKVLRALAYLSLVLGGFLVILFLAFSYSAIWRHEFLPLFPENPGRLAPVNNASEGFPLARFPQNEDPFAVVFSLQSIAILLIGVIFLVNGYYLLKHLRHKEHAEVKKFVTSSLLSNEEKAVYDELLKCGGEATQKQLSLNTGYSAVKVYRVIKRLEGKQVVKTFPYGMTKKIVLNEST
jgi:uncharacterized membrane protein